MGYNPYSGHLRLLYQNSSYSYFLLYVAKCWTLDNIIRQSLDLSKFLRRSLYSFLIFRAKV